MTTEQRALAAAATTAQLILDRNGAPLSDLRHTLHHLRATVRLLPTAPRWPDAFEPRRDYAGLRATIGPAWPELGFYDEQTSQPGLTDTTECVGDAIDDLADLVDDLRGALLLDATDPTAAASWLSFHAEAHWGYHVDHLLRHLDVLLADRP